VVYALPAEPARGPVQAESGDAERPALLVFRSCCAEDIRRWRAENPQAVAAYNAARREGPFPKTCSVCGRDWLAARRRSVRCPECQERHLRERKR
jgi:hypothetical protein